MVVLLSKNEADCLARQQWHDYPANTRLRNDEALPRERLSPLAGTAHSKPRPQVCLSMQWPGTAESALGDPQGNPLPANSRPSARSGRFAQVTSGAVG